MPKFMFWNLGGRARTNLVWELATENDVDVVILAECPNHPAELLLSLNREQSRFQYASGLCERLIFFAAFDSSFFVPLFESARISIRRLTLPARQSILVAAAHLPSKMHFSEASQSFECTALADEIAKLEELEGHRRTLLLGDLNVNPFEEGVVATRGLHAVPSRRVAARGTRTVQGRAYPFFYNPMWSHFGDSKTPEGTFYYEKSEHVVYYWNLFDQALIRPDLAQNFDVSNLRIVTKIGSSSLVDNDGRPDKTIGSDHLPIVIDIHF